MKRKLIFILFSVFAMFSCGRDKPVFAPDSTPIIKNMTFDQKIGQMIITAVPGTQINDDAARIIKTYMPGGVIFFGFNIGNKNHIKRFVSDLQSRSVAASGIPLFVTIDQEGGRVRRIENGVTQFPGNMAAGVCDDEKLTYNWARILGMELRLLGVNMNLAPDLDVNNNPDNPVINTRSFGSDVDLVSRMGSAYIKGLQDSKCAAVGKHFPGHGDTNKDSHHTLPVINYDMERLRRIELKPFVKAINTGVDAIMTAHVAYPKILGNRDSATISKKFLTDVLRGDMRFTKLIMTDAIEMDAISKRMDMGDAAVKSILAGSDVILITSYGDNIGLIVNSIKAAVANGTIPMSRINESVKRILDLKLKYDILEYSKGNTGAGTVVYSEKDLKLLKKAGETNFRLSRESIYYHGRDELLRGEGSKRVVVSSNKIIRDNIRQTENTIAVDQLWKANQSNLAKLKGKNTVVYFYIDEPFTGTVNSAYEFCKKNKYELVVVSGGNPFPLTRLKYVDSLLCSFSNTDESLKQLALCLNGEFTPKKNINLSFGFSADK